MQGRGEHGKPNERERISSRRGRSLFKRHTRDRFGRREAGTGECGRTWMGGREKDRKQQMPRGP